MNILSCTSQTSTERVAKFRFDFELADPNHLESILWAVKRVESVYAAYRVLPGTRQGRGRGRGVGPTRWQIRKTERSRLATGRVRAVGGAESTIERKTERSRLGDRCDSSSRRVGGAESTIERKTERRSARNFDRATELLERRRRRSVGARGDARARTHPLRRTRRATCSAPTSTSAAAAARPANVGSVGDARTRRAVLAGTGIRRSGPSRCSPRPTCSRPTASRPTTCSTTKRRSSGCATRSTATSARSKFTRRPPLLRPALPDVRGVQLRQAHRIGRPARAGGAPHRRAGQDRLPGRHQAAARRGRAHRDHPLPARRRPALRPGARLRRLG